MESLVRVLQRNTNRRAKKGSGFVQLFISKRLIQGAAAALTSIFVPIFLYTTFGENFYQVGFYFALLSILYALLIVPGMHLTNRMGFGNALILAGFLSLLLHVIYFFLTPENVFWLIVPMTVAIVGFRVFHWVPYHVDFALFTKKGERGRMVSLSLATIAFLGVIGPILAGFIIANAGYNALFAVTVVLLLAATISYAFVPKPKVHFEWSFSTTVKKLLSKKYRGVTLGEFANGTETSFTVIVWPIFLYEILNGDVFEIGAVSTVVVGVTIILQLVLGKYLDQKKGANEKTLRLGSSLYAIGWLVKIFVLSASQIFFVGLYHNVVKIFTKTPFTAILYDMTAEQGRYIDEFSVLREISVHLGRFLGLITVSLLSLFVPLGWTFVIAATASIALNMVYKAQH